MYHINLIFLQQWKIEKEEEMRIKMAQSGRYKQVRIKPFSQDIIERITKLFSILHEIENIIYTFRSFQYRRYMKNHGPDRMTFDDS